MNTRLILNRVLPGVALASLLFTASCNSTGKGTKSLRQVDNLLSRVEEIHVKCELSQRGVAESIAALHSTVQGGYEEDVFTAFGRFVEAVEYSEEVCEELGDAIPALQKSAEPFFDQWAEDLQSIQDREIRSHSRQRQAQTLSRYERVVETAIPAHESHEHYNQILQDHVLYLGRDLNQASVATLEGKLRGVSNLAKEVDQNMERCLVAARDYLETTAMPAPASVKAEAYAELEEVE